MPTTELDDRFSDDGASASTWAQAQQVLADAQLAFISTVRSDGRPHVTPLVPIWLDDALFFATGADEQKGHNLDGNAEVVVTVGNDAWRAGLDVVVEGRAERVTDRDLLARLAEAWTHKWDGRWEYEAGDDAFGHGDAKALVYRVAPRKVLAFGKEPFTHTRHRF